MSRKRKLTDSEARMLMAEWGMWRYYSPSRIAHRFGITRDTLYVYIRRGLRKRTI